MQTEHVPPSGCTCARSPQLHVVDTGAATEAREPDDGARLPLRGAINAQNKSSLHAVFSLVEINGRLGGPLISGR